MNKALATGTFMCILQHGLNVHGSRLDNISVFFGYSWSILIICYHLYFFMVDLTEIERRKKECKKGTHLN